MKDKLRANAELVVNKFSKNGDFGFNQDSVAVLEAFIESQRTAGDLNEEKIDSLVSTLGAFLGECIINCYGGEWREVFGSWAVAFDGQYAAFPFAEVRRQIDRGKAGGEGIKGFFDSIPILIGTSTQPPRKKAWWKFWERLAA